MAKGYSPRQIVRYLREAEGKLANGSTVPEVAREIGISETTFHRWKRQYGGMSPEEAKRLKELEKENARLKKMVADQALDIDMLKEVNRGNTHRLQPGVGCVGTMTTSPRCPYTSYTYGMERSAHALEDTLRQLEIGLQEMYGGRYRGLVLYGSQARGEADAGSDVDLLLLLSGVVEAGKEIRRASALVSRLSLESDQVLSVIPVSAEDYHGSREPYLENARREGRLLATTSA